MMILYLNIDKYVANTFCIIMKKNLVQQIEQDILPTMPLVCTDSNLRSVKEYHKDGWKSTQSNKSIDQMIDISNDQIYESEKTKIFISHKERKKVYDKMKKDNSLLRIRIFLQILVKKEMRNHFFQGE